MLDLDRRFFHCRFRPRAAQRSPGYRLARHIQMLKPGGRRNDGSTAPNYRAVGHAAATAHMATHEPGAAVGPPQLV